MVGSFHGSFDSLLHSPGLSLVLGVFLEWFVFIRPILRYCIGLVKSFSIGLFELLVLCLWRFLCAPLNIWCTQSDLWTISSYLYPLFSEVSGFSTWSSKLISTCSSTPFLCFLNQTLISGCGFGWFSVCHSVWILGPRSTECTLSQHHWSSADSLVLFCRRLAALSIFSSFWNIIGPEICFQWINRPFLVVTVYSVPLRAYCTLF